MTEGRPLGVGIVGCGNIAGPYAADLATYPHLRLVGVTDADRGRADAFAAEHGCRVYAALDELLADDAIELVVNLTPHRYHHPVTRQALLADRHVFSEKPLALTVAEARELVELAERQDRRLGSAPSVLLGELAQSAWHYLRDERIGQVRLVFADVNWGRPETWHPSPQAFHEVGPLIDVGVYPLTLLTGIFGPARRVTALSRVLLPERATTTGAGFTVTDADLVIAIVELESGVLVRLTADFYASSRSRQRGIEFHGDTGSLWISNWFQFDGELEWMPFDGEYEPLPLVRAPSAVMRWAAGVAEMATAIGEGRPHRVSGAHAAHVVEIMTAAATSARSGRPETINSDPGPQSPMPWAEPRGAEPREAEAGGGEPVAPGSG